MNSIFTDQEHRILLSAIGRERKICEECDREIGDNDGYMLVPIVDSIERKVYEIQHQDADLKKHFLVATEPEWDGKNRFWRCPSCKRRIHEYHGHCKHCGKKINWQPLMKKIKKMRKVDEAEGKSEKQWISVDERLPEDIDIRYFMCLVENHLEDPPMFCQYEEEYGFGFWKDIYDPVTLGFVDSEFETMEELGYEKVLYWMPMIEPPEEAMQDD